MNRYIRRIVTHLVVLILVMGIFCGISGMRRSGPEALQQTATQASLDQTLSAELSETEIVLLETAD